MNEDQPATNSTTLRLAASLATVLFVQMADGKITVQGGLTKKACQEAAAAVWPKFPTDASGNIVSGLTVNASQWPNRVECLAND